MLPWQKPLAWVLAAALAIESTLIFFRRAGLVDAINPPAEAVNKSETLVQLGMVLFQQYLLPFEVTSILLLVAMVGVIVLVRKEKRVY